MISAILTHKTRSGVDAIAHTAPTATINDVSRQLHTRRIGAVLVMDSAGQLLGIVSERDIVASLAENGARTMEMTAAQLMTRDLHIAHPSTTVAEAMEMMTNGRFRHLPVMDGDRLLDFSIWRRGAPDGVCRRRLTKTLQPAIDTDCLAADGAAERAAQVQRHVGDVLFGYKAP